MNCPSGIKSFYVNAIHYSKSMTIASVPAMWRDEVQAAIDEIDAAEKAALQEKWTSWKSSSEAGRGSQGEGRVRRD